MEIPYTVKARQDTGLWNAKVGIWLFLASEVMLFGGLFSSYIFLRIGADFNWPVQVLDAKLGMLNTAVLIASSVTIVMAWASLKLGKIAAYRMYMLITVLCAGGFMVIKSIEYGSKFTHYGVRLTDGSLLEGHFPAEGYRVEFSEATKLTLEVDGVYPDSDPAYFLRDCATPEGERLFKDADGKEVKMDAAYISTLLAKVQAERSTVRDNLAKARKAGKPASSVSRQVKTSFDIAISKPLAFKIRRGAFGQIDPIYSYTADSVLFRDNTALTAKLVKDDMALEVDLADVRDCPDFDKALAWHYLGDAQKQLLAKQRDEKLAEFTKAYDTKKYDPYKSAHFKRHALVLKNVADHGTAGGHGEHGGATEDPHASKADTHGVAHAHPTVLIKAKDITFWSNFTPKYNTYYAIYFALTSLHGLHVIAGAMVLAYFALCDGKLLREDPEHMANRVEVGGLFWHFVDLVWIFLFPLLYLL
jgi:heme/copper-type cytochrome/quinol oxidase subunit 3